MSTVIAALLAEFWPWIAGALGGALALLGAWWRGRSKERERQEDRRARDYEETMRRAHEAQSNAPVDPDTARDELRRRGKR